MQSKVKGAAMHGLNVDIHDAVNTDQKVHDMHERAEVFPPNVEYAFSYLQVFSACCGAPLIPAAASP